MNLDLPNGAHTCLDFDTLHRLFESPDYKYFQDFSRDRQISTRAERRIYSRMIARSIREYSKANTLRLCTRCWRWFSFKKGRRNGLHNIQDSLSVSQAIGKYSFRINCYFRYFVKSVLFRYGRTLTEQGLLKLDSNGRVTSFAPFLISSKDCCYGGSKNIDQKQVLISQECSRIDQSCLHISSISHYSPENYPLKLQNPRNADSSAGVKARYINGGITSSPQEFLYKSHITNYWKKALRRDQNNY